MSVDVCVRLNELLAGAGLDELDLSLASRFAGYSALILRWNQRINLTSVRDEDAILSRHFVESIACARALPAGVATLLDFGSGAGFPGIPIALCRPEIEVTLAESQSRKAAFLREAVRVLKLATHVHTGRAESLGQQFDCVTLRAVDHMKDAVKTASGLVAASGWLALMTTGADLGELQAAAGDQFGWNSQRKPLPGSTDRVLALGVRHSVPAGPAAFHVEQSSRAQGAK